MKRKICIVAEDYPYEGHPNYPFVQELAYSLSNEGYECCVIAPQSLSRSLIRHEALQRRKTIDISPDNKRVTVYRPYVITFSNAGSKIINQFTYKSYQEAIFQTLKSIKDLDYVYCYFWHIGLITAKALLNKKVKLFVQASECDISVLDSYKTEKTIHRINGVVCASRKNYDESRMARLIDENSYTAIIPNGFRKDEFYQIDKAEARKKVGIDPDVFIAAFVGDFNERKGVDRLSKAVDRFDDVYSLFIGKGNIVPTCNNILYQGLVPHNQLYLYLNCADVFVLPTQAEGCCNAIIEAVACGLPVISSNKPFNNEILDDSYSIRINENSIDEIEAAIKRLKSDESLRVEMSNNAKINSEKFHIAKRAKAIAGFLENS